MSNITNIHDLRKPVVEWITLPEFNFNTLGLVSPISLQLNEFRNTATNNVVDGNLGYTHIEALAYLAERVLGDALTPSDVFASAAVRVSTEDPNRYSLLITMVHNSKIKDLTEDSEQVADGSIRIEISMFDNNGEPDIDSQEVESYKYIAASNISQRVNHFTAGLANNISRIVRANSGVMSDRLYDDNDEKGVVVGMFQYVPRYVITVALLFDGVFITLAK